MSVIRVVYSSITIKLRHEQAISPQTNSLVPTKLCLFAAVGVGGEIHQTVGTAFPPEPVSKSVVYHVRHLSTVQTAVKHFKQLLQAVQISVLAVLRP